MSSHESRPRPETYADGLMHASPSLLKMMELLQEGDFESLLERDSFQDLFDRLAEIDLDDTDFENPRKVFLQVFFKDPSRVRLAEGESAWIGCEYDIWGDSDEAIMFVFRYLTIPEATYDPLYNPELKKHSHLTIGDDEINWARLLPAE